MSKRYEVEVARTFIVYAGGPRSAGRKAAAFVRTLEASAVANVHVRKVKRLPDVKDEEQAPLIDRAPSRETRK